jgi:hypothetical protein
VELTVPAKLRATQSGALNVGKIGSATCTSSHGDEMQPATTDHMAAIELGEEGGLHAHGSAFALVVVGKPTLRQNAAKRGSCW